MKLASNPDSKLLHDFSAVGNVRAFLLAFMFMS